MCQQWLSQSALGKSPQPTLLHLSYIKASNALAESMLKRRVIAMFFAFILAIGVIWVRCARSINACMLPLITMHSTLAVVCNFIVVCAAGLGRLFLCARVFALFRLHFVELSCETVQTDHHSSSAPCGARVNEFYYSVSKKRFCFLLC